MAENDIITRGDMFLSNAGGEDTQIPTPITREEMLLAKVAEGSGGGGGGATNYERLSNRPKINGITLSGDKTGTQLGLQNKLSFDNTPIANSKNPVTSGGVSEALAEHYTKTQADVLLGQKEDRLTFDTTPTVGSLNPVTSAGVYAEFLSYYTKSQTYTKAEVDDLITAISTMSLEIVQTLPTTDISRTTIYLVPAQGEENVYNQYAYINDAWALLGDTGIDLADYYTKTQADNLLDRKIDTDGTGLSKTGTTLNHSNTVAAKVNTNISGLSYDAQGHITGKGTEYTADTNFPQNATDNKLPTSKAVADHYSDVIKLNSVDELPVTGSQNTLYEVPDETSPGNYKYYIYSGDEYRTIGGADAYTKTESDERYLPKSSVINSIYPQGSIYVTYAYLNPSTFLGGTWELVGGQDARLNYYPAFAIPTDNGGETISESLPNITGDIRVRGAFRNSAIGRGAFRDDQTFGSADEDGLAQRGIVNFAASNSSAIYKDNAHVNVNAIKLFFWRRTDNANLGLTLNPLTIDTTITSASTNNNVAGAKAVYDFNARVLLKYFSTIDGAGPYTLDDSIANYRTLIFIGRVSNPTYYISTEISAADFKAGMRPLVNLGWETTYDNRFVYFTYVSDTTVEITYGHNSEAYKIYGIR